MQLTITFEYMNQENRERAKSIKANIKAKEKRVGTSRNKLCTLYRCEETKHLREGYDEIRERSKRFKDRIFKSEHRNIEPR